MYIIAKKFGIWVCFSCGNEWEQHRLTQCVICRRFTAGLFENLCSAYWAEGFGLCLDFPDLIEFVQTQSRVEK